MIARFGAALTWVGAYTGVILLIPTQQVSTAMGVCNFFSRSFTMLAPLVAELQGSIPVIIMGTMTIVAFIASQRILD